MTVLDYGKAVVDSRLNETDSGLALDAADQRALARQKPNLTTAELTELVEYGEVVARSKMFGDMQSTAQAVVKLSIGRELGLTKTASLTGVHVFQTADGTRVIIAGQLLLAKVNAHPDYRLEIVRTDAQACWLQPWKRGGLFGSANAEEFARLTPRCFAKFPGSPEMQCKDGLINGVQANPCPECAGSGYVPVKFSIEDAKRLNLLGKKNWMGDPESMCLWRCVAKTQRRYFPDVLAIGQAYLADEMEEIVLPMAMSAAGQSPQPITLQRPRRTSEAPPPNTIDASPGTFATTVIGPDGMTDTERGRVETAALEAQAREIEARTDEGPEPLGPESFGGEDFPADEPTPAPDARTPDAPSLDELEVCEGGKRLNTKCDACRARAKGKKTCPKCKCAFEGLFCPACMERGQK